MQFVPYDGVYVYFRYDAQQTVMCIMNTNEKPFTLSLNRFAEMLDGFTKANDVVTGTTHPLKDSIALRPMCNLVLELQP
ncbi:cyclomaltodextrinase C-terminal domain-containing protein [Niabella sp. W65]|nr:cyclomaltodextrinase C-terminal domain-containing protein [Niabella sp. W65]MCH7366089.1 cyclomaltodextrinase C-terminal domain-containing protein [Niabella sp. W65]ULT41816.1 cyclomaltodextrinase C-terminal domain-containing protein [Niabella sp. I65]